MYLQRKRVGFTIVELVIAVTVIGILAAITIVGYRGVQERGRAASASAALKDSSGKLKLYKFDNGTYPTSTNLSSAGVVDGNGVTYQYSSDGATYCLTATNKNVSYKIAPDGTPTTGACAGHGANGVAGVTNVIQNPSAELSTAGYSNPNGSTVVQNIAQAKNGSTSVVVTLPSIAGSSSGVNVASGYNVPTNLKASTTYTFSAWVYVPSATVNVLLSTQGAGVASACTAASRTTATKDAWARISCPFTTAASGGLSLYVLNAATSTAGMQFYVDSVMISEGTTLHSYADGTFTTDNWVWNGSQHASTSSGPAL